jgi:HAE1 family hydrophobic/amphiphilic exporter-1
MWLTRFCIQRPLIVTIFFIGLAIFGFVSYQRLGRSEQPNVNFPVVVVVASYPGASPTEMEKLVIKPIEDQLDGIEHLDQMTATAQEGSAVVVVQFQLDTDLNYAAIDVQRRVDTARVYMPSDLVPPDVEKNGADQSMLTYALSSQSLSGPALQDLVTDRIVPEIKAFDNVSGVDVYGEPGREMQIDVDPLKLLAAGATITDIYNAVSQNNANLPGGRVDSPTRETSVSVHADIINAQDLTQLPIPIYATVQAGGALETTSANSTMLLGQFASVTDGHSEQRSISLFNGLPAVLMDVNRTVNSDEISTTKRAREQMKTIFAKYPQIKFKEVYAQADFTQASLNGVFQSLFEGIFLTAIVLMLFLHAWRNAIVVMIAIPSSLLATFVVMKWLNFTLDNISLMALSLIIGILVDDSIVVLENITRHRDLGQGPDEAAISGRSEIGGAAIAITLVDVVVFFPLAFLSGFVGKYFVEFGIVVTVATLFSLFVSCTLTPMLAAKWSVKARSSAPPAYLEWFQIGFDRLATWYRDHALPAAFRHRWLVAGGCVLAVFDSLTLPAGIQAEFVAAGVDAIAAAGCVIWFLAARRRRHVRASALAIAICVGGTLLMGCTFPSSSYRANSRGRFRGRSRFRPVRRSARRPRRSRGWRRPP